MKLTRRALLSGAASSYLVLAQSINPQIGGGIGQFDGGINSKGSGGPSGPSCTYTPVTTGTQSVAYTGATPSASGGTPAYTFSETGSLPSGLTISSSTGVISGTPSVSGSFPTIQVKVTDSASSVANCGTAFTLVIAAPTPWTPALLGAALIDWWDASNTSNMTIVGGNTITSWTGSVNATVINTTAFSSTAPSYSATAMNGAPGLGTLVAGYLGITSLSQGPAWSIFIAALPNTGLSGAQLALADPGSGTRIAQYLNIGSTTTISSIAFCSGSGDAVASVSGLTEGSLGLWYSQFGSTSVTMYFNGTAGTPATCTGTPASGAQFLKVGSPGNTYRGSWGDVILANTVLDTNQRQCLEGYEAWKYGIEASLPGGHPYKSAAPTTSSNCS